MGVAVIPPAVSSQHKLSSPNCVTGSLLRSRKVCYQKCSSRRSFGVPYAAVDPPLIRSASAPRARFLVRRTESASVVQNPERSLDEYMRLPASQYSVLDAQRIERVNGNTFRCYVYKMSFFNFEVCPVLLVRVDVEPDGACIRLLSCKLEGSPIVVAQNEKFSASMVNRISCSPTQRTTPVRQLKSATEIEVIIDIPFPFTALPANLIESTGNQVLEQLLRVMLPRFLGQLVKDYTAWSSGDTSRRPLGTGEL